MTTTVAIEQLTLQDLEQRLGLQLSDDPDFCREWRDRLPELGAIESKRAEFSVKMGIPQVLGYMLAAAPDRQARFGLVTNGSSFVFLKLAKVLVFPDDADTPLYSWQYDKSPELILDRADDLATVLQVMKKLGAIVSQAV